MDTQPHADPPAPRRADRRDPRCIRRIALFHWAHPHALDHARPMPPARAQRWSGMPDRNLRAMGSRAYRDRGLWAARDPLLVGSLAPRPDPAEPEIGW